MTTEVSKTPTRTVDLRADTDEEKCLNNGLAKAPTPIGLAINLFGRKSGQMKQDEVATQPSAFDNYQSSLPYHPCAQFENRHRFDPKERWTWSEERRVIRKLDWRVTAWACLALVAFYFPRANLHQANTEDFLGDLGLDTNDYNLANTVTNVCLLLAELPSQLLGKRLGPDVWIPAQMMLWSLASGAQFWLTGRKSFLVCRALIGLLQGGFFPNLILYMSYFFKSTEIPLRFALLALSICACSIVSPLLALGLFQIEHLTSQEGWRW